MTAATFHRLEGLEPDNLLAFLALLGLLRALELAHPDLQPRAFWDLARPPFRPVLTLRAPITRAGLSQAALDGLMTFKKALEPFSWPRLKNGAATKTALFADRLRQRALSQRCMAALSACPPNSERRRVWQLRCDLIACAAATHPNPKKRAELDPTPLKLPSGKMTFIGAEFDLISACDAEALCKSLFETWNYSFAGSSLRLSPDEARRHAYQASDPSPEGSRTELGASALSALGLLAFPMSDGHRRWRMVAYSGKRTEGRISWPIWGSDGGPGASPQAIIAMLNTMPVGARKESHTRNPVHAIATARRYLLDPGQGDYGNIARAELTFAAASG